MINILFLFRYKYIRLKPAARPLNFFLLICVHEQPSNNVPVLSF